MEDTKEEVAFFLALKDAGSCVCRNSVCLKKIPAHSEDILHPGCLESPVGIVLLIGIFVNVRPQTHQ